MGELKRCSCSGEPELIMARFPLKNTFFIHCTKCEKVTKQFDSDKEAENSWNISTHRPSRRKYRPGPKITSLNELMEQDFVYWGNKITPKGWFQNWQLHMANMVVRAGYIRQAIKIESEKSK